MATFVKISPLVESGESLMITFTGDKLKAGGYELCPEGTTDELKAKDTRIAVLERALELLWEDAGTVEGIDEKDSINDYIAQATRERADEAKEKKDDAETK